jgi:glyceraldehyde 3-phosphate dehydrogenase
MDGIAIYGFGRIGRSVLKASLRQNLFTPRAVADIRDAATFAALFTADSNYGCWHELVSSTETGLNIGGREIAYYNAGSEIPNWGELGIGLVIDCTGRATVRAGAQAHLDRGAKKVLISAASKSKADCDVMLLPGINMESYQPEQHHIISMASCTTNAVAPVVKILRERFGNRIRLLLDRSRLHQLAVAHRPTAERTARFVGSRRKCHSVLVRRG